MSFHTFVVEAGGLNIVVDTCTGNSKDRPLIPEFNQQHRPFLTHLAASGFPSETIDLVVCTHLHVDHVGWNTQSHDSFHASAFADSVEPIIDAGLVDPVETDMALTGEVLLRSTPGTTRAYERVDRRALCDHR
jgi:glyoxylase-like metal-dependent hydrolase (beta-lactamase superfamily II)